VVKTHIPNVTNILFAPKYRVQIFDKDKNKTNSYMGTMANLMFDMFKDLGAKQK
jgi:translation initiation factor 2 alpha subunit (eIF-2alpha)